MAHSIEDLLDYKFGIENNLEALIETNLSYEDYDNYSSPFLVEDYNFPIGDPDQSGHISQTTGFTCAVVSQQMILNDFGIVNPDTGAPISEAQLVYDATINGWLYEGTSPSDMGNLLTYYGVPCHHDSGLENMIQELARGHKVIVGVDANELWDADNQLVNDIDDIAFGESANHAIVVKGIKFDEAGEPIVVVNDPGKPDGAGNEYPLDIFQDAFQDSGCHYVATDSSPPGLAEDEFFGMNFDLESGSYIGSEMWLRGDVSDGFEKYGPERDDKFVISKTIDMLSDQERKKIMLFI
jgi:hypothetical protein